MQIQEHVPDDRLSVVVVGGGIAGVEGKSD